MGRKFLAFSLWDRAVSRLAGASPTSSMTSRSICPRKSCRRSSAATIDRIRIELEAERSTEQFAKRKESAAQRREKVQAEYVEDFFGAVVEFLAFHPNYTELAQRLARAVSDHATPVGSGTVARTKRIPVQQRAEAAVIAWMRHQTTAYDSMQIARIKGKRREVRRMLAQRSKELLSYYRRGDSISEACPLKKAMGLLH